MMLAQAAGQGAEIVCFPEAYLPGLRAGGKVLFICPQERGYASDATHVRFTDDEDRLLAISRVTIV